MKAAGYVRPASIAEASAARADGGIIIAGGTDVMVKGRARGVYAGRTLVDVSKLEELRQVRERDGAVEIGTACTLAELCDNALVAERLPLLADACAHVGGVQIRNRATIGGNVALRRSAAGYPSPKKAARSRNTSSVKRRLTNENG